MNDKQLKNRCHVNVFLAFFFLAVGVFFFFFATLILLGFDKIENGYLLSALFYVLTFDAMFAVYVTSNNVADTKVLHSYPLFRKRLLAFCLLFIIAAITFDYYVFSKMDPLIFAYQEWWVYLLVLVAASIVLLISTYASSWPGRKKKIDSKI